MRSGPRSPAWRGKAVAVTIALPMLLVLLSAGPAAAHGPDAPAPDWQRRLLVDQNHDRVWSGKGHDLIALDVEEVWVPEEQNGRIVFRLMVDAYRPLLDADGELRETFNVTIDGRTFTPTLATGNESAFSGEGWDYVGAGVDVEDLSGSDADHGDGDTFTVKLGLDYATLNLTLEEVAARPVNLTSFQVISWDGADRQDLMVGGAWTDPDPLSGEQELVETSEAEQEEAITQFHLPYTLRGPGIWISAQPAAPTVEVDAGGTATLNLTLRNLLPDTNQSMEVAAVGVPDGWNVTFDQGPHVVCGTSWAANASGGTCDVVVPLNLTPAANASDGIMDLEVLGGFDQLAGTTRATAAVGLFLAQPVEETLHLTSLEVEPGVGQAVVRWNTTANATSLVRYGLTLNYTDTLRDDAPVRAHELVLTGLAPNTTYHYQVVSANGSLRVQSLDATFTTRELPGVAFTAPGANATLEGEVQVALASDDWEGAIALRLDGARLADLEGPPYTFEWDTNGTADGLHTLQAVVQGVVAAELQVTVDNVVGDPGALLEGSVSPASGTTETTFTFAVVFRDTDGEGPASAEVLIDGEAHAMQAGAGAPEDGVSYTFATRLPAGEHTFAFRFVTSELTMRLPVNGTFPGPVVAAPPGGGNGTGDGGNGTGDGGDGTTGPGGDGDGNGDGADGGEGPGDGTGAGDGPGQGGDRTGEGAGEEPRGFLGLPGPPPAVAVTAALAVAAAMAFRTAGRPPPSRRR